MYKSATLPLQPHVSWVGVRRPRPARYPWTIKAFHIDRRKHLELAWERQNDFETLLQSAESQIASGKVVELTNLNHLERCLEIVGGRVAVLALYTRSCGICKAVCGDLMDELSTDSHNQQAGIVFFRHDVMNEFDFATDIAQLYGVKAVPKFLFLVDGAVRKTVTMADVRMITTSKDTALGAGKYYLKKTLWELLVKNAPSARR